MDTSNGNGEASLEEITNPDRYPELRQECKENPEARKWLAPKPLILDGLDPERSVGVTFISDSDYLNCGGVAVVPLAHVEDLKEVAEYVAGKAKKESEDCVYLGVFYDPVGENKRLEHNLDHDSGTDMSKSWEKEKGEAKAKSKELLRQQVQDFTGWLKEKKVVP